MRAEEPRLEVAENAMDLWQEQVGPWLIGTAVNFGLFPSELSSMAAHLLPVSP
jgi:hypothetical protein